MPVKITSRSIISRSLYKVLWAVCSALFFSAVAAGQTNVLSFSPAIPQQGEAVTATVSRVPGNCLVGGTYSSALSGSVLTTTHAFATLPPPPPPSGACIESYNIGSLSQGTYQVVWEERFDFLTSQRSVIATSRLTVSSVVSVPLNGGVLLTAIISVLAIAALLKRK